MPFYEYECSSCKYSAEVLQKISDTPLRKCPSCGKGAFKRLISAPVFRLKGSGWYETDFKSDKESKRNLAGAEAEASKPEAKTEAKAEAKARSEGRRQARAEAGRPRRPPGAPARPRQAGRARAGR